MGQKKMLVLTMLCISLFQMGMVGLAPVVSAVVDAFPGTSALAAQMATTFLNLVLVGVALLSGTISRHFGRRKMCAGGMLLFALAGICGAFFTVGLWAVFVWSAFLGAGTGLFVPAVSSMMIDYLDDGERSAVAGLQTAFVNLGGMALSFLAGLLAGTVWSNAYLVFLAAGPVFFLCLCGLPREKAAPGKADRGWRSGKLPRAVWLAALQTFLFAVLYFAFSTNISLLLVERGVTDTAMSGIATAIFMLGGCLFGFVFTRLLGLCKGWTACLAFVLLAASYLVIYCFDGIVPLLAAAFVGGGSLSVIFPFFLVTIAGQVDPTVSVMASSLILSVGPNLGSFVSPMILTNLSRLLFGPGVSGRFLLAAILAVSLAGVLFALGLKKRGAAIK